MKKGLRKFGVVQRLEQEKLRAEIICTEAEAEKCALESKKLARDLKYSIFSLVTNGGGFLIALVAVGTLGLNLWKEGQLSIERSLISQHENLEKLVDESPVIRAAAAYSVGRLAEEKTEFYESLVIAFALENHPQVQSAQLRELEKNTALSISQFRKLISTKKNEVIGLFDRWEILKRRHDSSLEDVEEGNGDVSLDLFNKELLILDQINEAQDALVRSADAIRKFECQNGKDCGIDLSGGFPLRWYSFVGSDIDLENANFSQSFLDGADFYDLDLSGANFEGAFLSHADFKRSTLVGAIFENAKMLKPGEVPLGAPEVRRIDGTRFSFAKIENTNFTGACLSGADFRNADLSMGDFNGADFYDAKYSEGQLKDLKEKYAKRSEERC